MNTVTDTDKIHWPVMMLTVVYSWYNHRLRVYSRSRLFLVRLKQKECVAAALDMLMFLVLEGKRG